MKQFGQSKPMAHAACACFACASMFAIALDGSLSVLFLCGVAAIVILIGCVRLIPAKIATAR